MGIHSAARKHFAAQEEMAAILQLLQWSISLKHCESLCGTPVTYMTAPRWCSGKESAGNAGDTGLMPGSGRFPGGGNGNPTPVCLPGKSYIWAFLVAQTVKHLSVCNAGDPGSIPRSGRCSGEGNGNPTPVSLPGKSHGAWWATIPWGRKVSDVTEQLPFTTRY